MRGVCGRALKLPFVREGCVTKEPEITGRQPDSGKPTVRDERGACGNVGYGRGYTGTYSGNADTAKPEPKVARAVFLPDSITPRHAKSLYIINGLLSRENPRLCRGTLRV